MEQKKFCKNLRELDVNIWLAGGETADVGDLVRTVIVDSTVTARMPRKMLSQMIKIAPGDVIVGLSSSGLASSKMNTTVGWEATD